MLLHCTKCPYDEVSLFGFHRLQHLIQVYGFFMLFGLRYVFLVFAVVGVVAYLPYLCIAFLMSFPTTRQSARMSCTSEPNRYPENRMLPQTFVSDSIPLRLPGLSLTICLDSPCNGLLALMFMIFFTYVVIVICGKDNELASKFQTI